jgi:hypothetical protein
LSLSGEEIRARISASAARWSVYDGSERGEAQTFLNKLFEYYGTERNGHRAKARRSAPTFGIRRPRHSRRFPGRSLRSK